MSDHLSPMPDVTPRRSDYDDGIVAAVTNLIPRVRAIYRYGSAGGPFQRRDSDIDVAVLLEQPLPFEVRLELATRLMALFERDVDVVDMRAIPVTLRVQIAAHGARLYAADADEAAEYESRAFSDYARLNEERHAILDDIRRRGAIHG